MNGTGKGTVRSALAAVLVSAYAAPAAGAFAPDRVGDKAVEPVVWRTSGPGGGGYIMGLTAGRHSPGRLYAACDVGGFAASDDGGRSWKISNTGLHDLFALCVAEHPIEPRTLYLGMRGGLYRSRNSGRTWTELTNGFPAKSRGVYTLEASNVRFSPADPDTLYVTDGLIRYGHRGRSALYRSVDGGETWANIIPPGTLPPETPVYDLSIAADNTARMLISTKAGLWRSDDAGRSWRRSNAGLPAHLRTLRLARCAASSSRVYVSLFQSPGDVPWNAGIWRSDDDGRTWRAVNGGLPKNPGTPGGSAMHAHNFEHLAVHPRDPDIVYAGGSSWVSAGVWKTTDGGGTWTRIFGARLPEGWIDFWGATACALDISPVWPDTLALGTHGHVFRTENGGGTWANCYAESLPDGRFRSRGLETTCLHAIDADPARKGRFYCGFYDVGLLVTEDDGLTYRRCMTGIPRKFSNGCYGVKTDPRDPCHVFGAFGQWGGEGRGCIAESFDSGCTWSVLADSDHSGIPGTPRCFCLTGNAPPYTLWYCSYEAGLAVSRDSGRIWRRPDPAVFPSAARVNAVAVSAGTVYAGVAADEEEPGALWSSRDGGATWTRLTDDALWIGAVQQIDVSGPRIVFSARGNVSKKKGYRHGGVWYSGNGGATWKRILTDRFVTGVKILGPRVLAAPFDHPYHDHAAGGGVLSTRDAGASWTTLNSPSFKNGLIECFCEDPFSPGTVWAGTCGNAIQITTLR